MSRHLATFTRRPGSSLYTLATEPPQVAASAQVTTSPQVAPPCSCRLLSHQTLLWHHRLGHPSLLHLRGMHSRVLVSGLPRSLPPLPPSPAPPCLPCVEGRERAAPHSSSFPQTTPPLQTLHMDVVDVLIPWICTVRLQLRERFCTDLRVLRLHSYRGGEFSSDLLQEFCCGEGILQSFTLPASPQQNGIAERRIGLVMEVAPQPLAPCLLAGDLAYTALDVKVGDASMLWFYHPTSRRIFSSKNVNFGESVPFYHLFSYRCAPPPPPPPFLSPGPPLVDPLPPKGPAPLGVSQEDPLPGTASGGAASGGAGFEGDGPGGAEPGGAESGGAESGGAESGGAEPGVLSMWVWSLGVLSLRVWSLGVLCRRVRSLGVLRRGVLLLLKVLRVLCHDCLPVQSHPPRSSCASGLLNAPTFGAGLSELETLPLETLELEVLEILVE
ncbi:unnamed protein product [Closterium sp. NIES-53]